jgi:tRNA(His) guanylyltransferase
MNVEISPETKDALGQRMKSYEKELKTFITPKSYVVLRLDGRAFHTWTKGLERPYDIRLIKVMGQVMNEICKEMSTACLGFQQSDEISLLFSDRAREETELWFGGNVQKIVSVASSIATGHFARAYPERSLAQFDARVFTLPSEIEVRNYFRWRQADIERNSVSMTASSYYSPKQLHGMTTAKRREMLIDKGIDIDGMDSRFLYGQVCYPDTRTERVEYTNKRTGEKHISPLVERRVWETIAAPRLDANPDGWLAKLLKNRSIVELPPE